MLIFVTKFAFVVWFIIYNFFLQFFFFHLNNFFIDLNILWHILSVTSL